MYGFYQSVCGKTEGKSALQICMEELWEETRIRILPNRLMWICHDHYFSCDVFGLELTEEEEPQWVEKDKHGPWTIFPWDLYLEAVAKGWTTPTHQSHLKEICEVLDILIKHVSWADEELHYYYDPEASVNTNQEIYSDTDEDVETDDEMIEEWEPTSQQTIEEAKRLSLERCHPKGACQACGFMGYAGRTLHECTAENVRDDQGDIIAYLNNETW